MTKLFKGDGFVNRPLVMYNPLEKLTTTIQMRAIQSPTTKGQNFLTGSVSLFASEIQRFFFLNSSINSYVRIPDLLELYGNQGNYIGNQDLQPEEGIQGEISLKYVPPKIGVVDVASGVTSFWNPSQNRIVWVQNSQNTMRTVNIGDIWIQGFEGFINLSLFELLQSNTQMTYNHSVNLTEDILCNKEFHVFQNGNYHSHSNVTSSRSSHDL